MSRDVLLVAGHGEVGGGEIMLLAVADALRELGADAVVVAPENPGRLLDTARERGHRVVPVPAHRSVIPWGRLLATRRAVAAVRRGRPGSLVWCHGLRPSFATVGTGQRVVHAHRAPTGLQKAALWLSTLGARAVLVPSEDTRTRLPTRLRHRTRVFGNWTSEMVAVPRLRAEGSDNCTVGFLGRLAPEKGISTLVDALERTPHPPGQEGAMAAGRWPPRVLMGGEPLFVTASRARDVDRAIRRLGPPGVRCGWVEPAEFLGKVDVLVCPSEWPEPFGLVAAEAMAARVPVVVSDAGALPSVVGPQHPYVARAGDAADLARVIRRALDERGTPAGDAAVAAARRRWEALWSPAAGRERVRELGRELGVLP